MFEFSSIEQYHAQLREGNITCIQAVEHFLQRIESTSHLNAFIEVYTTEAREKAIQLDIRRKEGGRLGKLYGVVIGIKNVICYKDHVVTASSRILQKFSSLYSATALERLLDEDVIIIGNLNCDEFAMGSTNENSFYGRVLNSIDESKVPGGSSGGSAVAVQAGLCMAALGTDTGGSVRQPADFCGVIGLKPTYGRISRHGLVAYASSFDQLGIFGNSIPDITLLLEIMAGHDTRDSTSSQNPVPDYTLELSGTNNFKLAYFKEALDHPALDPEIARTLKYLIKELKEEGHQVNELSFDLLDYIVPAYYVLTTAEASSNLARYDGVKYGYRMEEEGTERPGLTDFYKRNRSAGFGREVKRRIMLGTFVLSAGYYDAYYTRAQKVRQLIRDKIQLIFSQYDIILLPTSPVTAFNIGEKMDDPIAMYLADIYTVLANLAGIPAISLPLFRHSNGLPFSVQAMANRFNELTLLRFSQRLMQQYKKQPVLK